MEEQNEKIRLFFLDNLEAILNGEFEELIAEMKANEQEVWTWDTVDVETWSVLTGDIEQLTWEVLTWNIEVLTWDVVDFTGDVEQLTWDVLTWDVMTWSAIDAINETLEEIQAQRDAELAEIWKTLNEEVISWQEMNKDVIVSVEAPIASFPEWTELRITPIATKAQMEEIKDQLVENTDVTEESEVVAFDISFIYTLSFNWEEIELQPLEWKTVKVLFNYAYNDVLTEADNDDNKELKIYHLE